MVEYTLRLNSIFSCLADPTRRDILRHLENAELTVGEIAKFYKLTYAAISKHLKSMEKAKLITKRREGKQQVVKLSPAALKDADQFLRHYEKLWNDRFDALEIYLANEGKEK